MLNALFNAVMVLNGLNYLEWLESMMSYLMVHGHLYVLIESCPSATHANGCKAWNGDDVKAQGTFCLCCSPSIVSAIKGKDTAKEVWDYLEMTYGKPGRPIIYQDFCAAMLLTIPGDANPIPALNKLDAHYQCLETNKFTITKHVKAMILIAKLPAQMDNAIQVYLFGLKPSGTKTEIETITVRDVHSAVILQWEQ